MENKRLNTRLECNERCQLRWSDSFYSATIRNVSLTGALVHFDNQLPDVQTGVKCTVHLCKDRDSYPCEYTCKIIRVETSDIALKFIGARLSNQSFDFWQ